MAPVGVDSRGGDGGDAWQSKGLRLSPDLSPSTADELLLGPGARRVIEFAQSLCLWLARHWLALANGINSAVLAGSALAPGLMAMHVPWLGDPLFALYRPICHQLPHRSFFLFDHPMAMCQRNVAIYGSMALAGMVFALVRDRAKPLPWRWYLLLLLPMAVDGGTQLLGTRESTWELRLLTGGIFGMATVWLAYPHLERFAAEIEDGETRRRGGAGTGRQGEPGSRNPGPNIQDPELRTRDSTPGTQHSSLQR